MKARTISMATMLSIVVLSAMMALPVSAETAATRDLPDACVDAGSQFDVTVDISDCAMGQLTETLCNGWTYVDGSATSTGAGGVTASTSGNDLALTFFSVSQVAYKVQAPGQEGECCGITGVLDDNTQTYVVDGETQDVCTCTGGAGPSATRDLPDECIDAGAQFDVTVDISDCAVGQLTETLCNGWTYVDGSATSTGAGGVTTSTSGNDLALTFFSVSQVAYKVQAPGQEGECCGITGVLDDNTQTYVVGGETQDVCICTPCPCDFCMPLEAGLNLVSVPRYVEVGGSSMASAVFNLGGIETCDSWDGCAGEWNTLPPAQLQVVPDRAYFVYKANAETLCLNETTYLGTQTLCADTWAMVGFPSRDPMTVAEFRTASSLNDDFTTVWLWNNGGWYPTEDMVPYRGYVLWMTVGGTMPGMVTK